MKNDKTLLRRVWQVLNSIGVDQLLSEGRVHGGGMFNLKPKERVNVDTPAIRPLESSCPP